MWLLRFKAVYFLDYSLNCWTHSWPWYCYQLVRVCPNLYKKGKTGHLHISTASLEEWPSAERKQEHRKKKPDHHSWVQPSVANTRHKMKLTFQTKTKKNLFAIKIQEEGSMAHKDGQKEKAQNVIHSLPRPLNFKKADQKHLKAIRSNKQSAIS